MFHPPSEPSVTTAVGYISNDGHHFNCRNPVVVQQPFHVYVSISICRVPMGLIGMTEFLLRIGADIFCSSFFKLTAILDPGP